MGKSKGPMVKTKQNKFVNPIDGQKQKYWVARRIEYLGRLKWVVWREVNGDKEDTTSIGTVWWSHYGCLPVKHVFSYRTWDNCRTYQERKTSNSRKKKVTSL